MMRRFAHLILVLTTLFAVANRASAQYPLPGHTEDLGLGDGWILRLDDGITGAVRKPGLQFPDPQFGATYVSVIFTPNVAMTQSGRITPVFGAGVGRQHSDLAVGCQGTEVYSGQGLLGGRYQVPWLPQLTLSADYRLFSAPEDGRTRAALLDHAVIIGVRLTFGATGR